MLCLGIFPAVICIVVSPPTASAMLRPSFTGNLNEGGETYPAFLSRLTSFASRFVGEQVQL